MSAPHAHHPDPHGGQHADADTHGQAMPQDRARSAVDEEHAVHAHGEHAGHSTAMFRNRFWFSLVLSVPVVVLSPMVAHLLGYHVPGSPARPGSRRCWARPSSATGACPSSGADSPS